MVGWMLGIEPRPSSSQDDVQAATLHPPRFTPNRRFFSSCLPTGSFEPGLVLGQLETAPRDFDVSPKPYAWLCSSLAEQLDCSTLGVYSFCTPLIKVERKERHNRLSGIAVFSNAQTWLKKVQLCSKGDSTHWMWKTKVAREETRMCGMKLWSVNIHYIFLFGNEEMDDCWSKLNHIR